jgi:hypothetical protein
MATEMTGSREHHALENDGVVLVAECVAGDGRLETDRRGDVAREHALDFLALVRVHLRRRPMRSFLPGWS